MVTQQDGLEDFVSLQQGIKHSCLKYPRIEVKHVTTTDEHVSTNSMVYLKFTVLVAFSDSVGATFSAASVLTTRFSLHASDT